MSEEHDIDHTHFHFIYCGSSPELLTNVSVMSTTQDIDFSGPKPQAHAKAKRITFTKAKLHNKGEKRKYIK